MGSCALHGPPRAHPHAHRPGPRADGLLRTIPRDIHTARHLGATPERYAALRCRTLLLEGSSSPPYLRRAVEALAEVVPGAERASFEGVSHDAPDMEAPERVAARLLAFYS